MALPISLAVTVNVTQAAQAVTATPLNQHLVVGTAGVLPVGTRLQFFTTTSQIAQGGYPLTSPEFIAASMVLAQKPTPVGVWIGKQDLTAVATATLDAAGTGYAIGNVLTLPSGAQFTVETIGTGGAIETIAPIAGAQGSGATIETGVATTGGSGTGATLSVTALGETAAQAVQACRIASNQWYTVTVLGAQKADIEAIAALTEAAQPAALQVYTTSDADAGSGLSTSIFGVLQALAYKQTVGVYSTTQAGLYPNNAYAAAAVAGALMGNNTGLAGSYTNPTWMAISGVAPEPFAQTSQLNAITAVGGNVIVDYGPYQALGGGGVLPSGGYVDQTIGLNGIASDCQYNVLNYLKSQNNVPLSNVGQSGLLNTVSTTAQKYVTTGFLSPGVWNGQSILFSSGAGLTTGQSLPKGFLVFSDTYANQTAGAKAARQAMPIYLPVILSDGVNSLVIGINVQS